jgi:hypothetical protein
LVVLSPLPKNITPFEGLYCRIISWLELKNLFQTFEQQDEVEIEQEIKEIRALLDNDNDTT